MKLVIRSQDPLLNPRFNPVNVRRKISVVPGKLSPKTIPTLADTADGVGQLLAGGKVTSLRYWTRPKQVGEQPTITNKALGHHGVQVVADRSFIAKLVCKLL